MRATGTQGPRHAGAYVRLSKWEPTDGDGDSSAVTRQEPDCRELIARRGWELVDVYCDEDRSAFTGARRPGYERLLDDVKSGRLDVVVVQHPDRLHRRPRELEDFVDLLEMTGTFVASCTAGDIDLETPEGLLVARITGAVAAKESEDKSRRLRRMMTKLVEDGKPNGGARPFGYRRTGAKTAEGDDRAMVLDEVEAPIATEIIERVAAGETLTGIAKDLNARGVVNGRGNPWSITNVRNVALNGRYAGLRIHNGVEAGRGTWTKCVEEAVWRRARALLTAEDRPQRRTARRYLLTGGLLLCGKCGLPLRSKPMHSKRGPVPVYGCRSSNDTRHPGCGGVTVKADAVERLVADAVIRRVEAPGFAQELHRRSSEHPTAAAEGTKVERQMAELADAYGEGAITMAEWKRSRVGLARRLAEAQAQLTVDTAQAAAGRYAGQTGALSEVWAKLPLDRRQAIIRSVVERIVVAPTGRRSGNAFDPSRVTIDWRG